MLSTVVPLPTQLNNPVINPLQLSLACQQSSNSSQDIPRDNRCFNSKDSNSKINDLSSLVIPVPPSLNDSVIIHHIFPRFINIHPDLHITQLQIRMLLQYLIGIHLIRQIPYQRHAPRMEVAIFMDAWLMCLSLHWHNDNSML